MRHLGSMFWWANLAKCDTLVACLVGGFGEVRHFGSMFWWTDLGEVRHFGSMFRWTDLGEVRHLGSMFWWADLAKCDTLVACFGGQIWRSATLW